MSGTSEYPEFEAEDGTARLERAMRKKLDGMSPGERTAAWWQWEGRRLTKALQSQGDRFPSFLEVMAYETGDLKKNEDGFFEVSVEFVEYLTRASREWPTAFDLAKRICVRNLASARLQPSLQPLAALMLSGDFSKPRAGHGRASKNWYRNLLIVRGVNSMSVYRINPTRNDASEQTSGCDLVVEAFNKAKRRDAPTYPTVRKVWDQREELLKDINEVELAMFSINAGD